MNQYDSNRILDLTKKIDYVATKNIDNASCYILNTCHIREKATEKVYHDIGRLKKKFRFKKKTYSFNYRMCCPSRGRYFT